MNDENRTTPAPEGATPAIDAVDELQAGYASQLEHEAATPAAPTIDDARAIALGAQAKLDDPDELEDTLDHTMRVALGLRAYQWRETCRKGSHPDDRPCPSWCVGSHYDNYVHQIDPRNPARATHLADFALHVRASLYEGALVDTAYPRVVAAAVIEPKLVQYGQGAPQIRVTLRHEKNGAWTHAEALRLTADDARDLAKALSFLVELADNGEAQREGH